MENNLHNLPFNPMWADGRRIVINWQKKCLEAILGIRTGMEKMKTEQQM